MRRIAVFILVGIIGLSGLNTVGQKFNSNESDTFKNPIISGFHPDPSICRVGDDYYLVNSSFEWYPGLPVYHSKDLVNWELIGYGIDRPDQVELPEGLGDSRGVYAPTIRYHDGLFYIINTCVQCEGNFYITAENPAGPWSEPVWLHSRGIDPDLFWDDDGTCYYTGHANITGVNDWPQKNGAWMQKLDLEQKKLVGPRKQLTHGHAKNARWTEGPHIYKIDGKYMLLVAEGGTGFHHAITVHHSDSIWGPYIPNHANPVLTHRHFGSDYPVHSVGHGDLVQTQKGDWWFVGLGKRKINGETLLARETFLTPVEFQEQEGIQTPVFNPGIGRLSVEQQRPDLPWSPVKEIPVRDEFENEKLALQWNFLRTPYTQWYRLEDGKLIINGRPQVLDSLANPSFIARRIQHHYWEASTKMSFGSKKINEQAGLVIYRKSTNHYQLLKEKNDLVLIKTLKDKKTEVARVECKNKEVVLKALANATQVQFYYGESELKLKPLGAVQDLGVISDEQAGGFNGPYVGLYCTSNGKTSKTNAIFDWFEYKALDKESAHIQKPIVWIYTDMTDPELKGNNHMGTINDPDDVSAMAGYLLMANEFDTKGIVVGSTHRSEHAKTPNQEEWAQQFFGEAYNRDVLKLNKNVEGYPEQIDFMQSCIKKTAERYNPDKKYENLEQYNTVDLLLKEAGQSSDVINVLCWGSLTEPAILVKHCMTHGRTDILNKLRFIAHWTNSPWRQGSPDKPEDVANCREDAAACAYLKRMAREGAIKYYECGAIGQHGIVSGSPKGKEYWSQFKDSELGKIFAEGKYVHDCVDDSDAATYWTLLGYYGVSLDDIASNGTNKPEVEKQNELKFKRAAKAIRSELLRRSKMASE